MTLDNECKDCLYNSQLKKVERSQTHLSLLKAFRDGVRKLCDNPPPEYCAPLLMRDIDNFHRKVFGCGIDYSAEKSAFNLKLLGMEEELYARVRASGDPLNEALKFAMASNYIDFARLVNLNEGCVQTVLDAAQETTVGKAVFNKFVSALKQAKTLCYLHDNCGEIVLDKILIRAIRSEYPDISVTSVVRAMPVINDVTRDDALQVGLDEYAEIADNGTNIPGTYLKEASPGVKRLLSDSDVIISKGLGNLETLYGCGYEIFYAFTCKCNHIAQRFGLPLWKSAFICESKK